MSPSPGTAEPRYTVVVPTTGRPRLAELLAALAGATGPPPREIVLVDDRPAGVGERVVAPRLPAPARVLRSGGRGPAGARNLGWRAASTEWVAFLDDDVVPAADWYRRVSEDLAGLGPEVAASQARIEVPLPAHRRPTDLERDTAGLAGAHWITADMAYRRAALLAVDGFDDRFPRAYREDADLALRVLAAGYRIVTGERTTVHPPRAAGFLASVRAQAGNADDVLMRHKHGRHWRERAGAGRGRFPWHVATTAAGAATLACLPRPRYAAAVALAWLLPTAEFALRRIRPGPRSRDEVLRMLVTSVAIPPVACYQRLRGELRHRAVRPAGSPPRGEPGRPAAVLFDRDGTLVRDVPYNGDPALVEPVAGAAEALRRLREAGVRLGVVSNQSGIARGTLTREDVGSVNARVEELLGGFDTWQVCPHGEDDGCDCRKPRPGLVHRAAAALGVAAADCVVIGDIGADMEAAAAAGARGILVPTARTAADEIARAPERAADITAAVAMALHGPLGTPGAPAAVAG